MAWNIALAAAIGACLQEILWWWERRTSLEEETYRKLIGSKAYWAITAAMILLAGAVSLIWFEGAKSTLRDALIFGAFLPLALKHAGKSFTGGEVLGEGGAAGFSLRNYLR